MTERRTSALLLITGNLESALLFKNLATLRFDAPLFDDVEQLRWQGAPAAFNSMAEKIGDARLAKRVSDLGQRLREHSSD